MEPNMEVFLRNIAVELHTLKVSHQKQNERIKMLTEHNLVYQQKMVELDNYLKFQAAEIAELRGQLMHKDVELTNAKMEIASLQSMLVASKNKEMEKNADCCCLRAIKSICCGFGYKEETLDDDFYYRGKF